MMRMQIYSSKSWCLNSQRSSLVVLSLLLMILPTPTAQARQQSAATYDVKRCTPKLVSKRPFLPPKTFHVRNGEKATGYSPVIAFEIREVQKARVKRSSGISHRDTHALESIGRWRVNARPGCGTIKMESDVLIHHY